MTPYAPPHDVEAEKAFISSLVSYPQGIEGASEYVLPEDIYDHKLRSAYLAASRLFFSGERVDSITVADECKRQGNPGVSVTDIVAVISDGGGPQWQRYADIVIGHSMRRRLLAAALELGEMAKDATRRPAEILESHITTMTGISSPTIQREPDDIAVEDFMNRPRENIAPWVVHGLVRRRHKVMIVGPEGGGKTWLIRFVAICAAYGIQPFRHEVINPVRTLIVDLENPEDSLFDSFEPMLKQVTSVSSVRETVNRLWWRPGGINLRSRADLAELENVIQARRPDLVCIGPLYAAYEISNKDFGWETAAREVQQALRSLYRKYDFATIIEDHAPQESGGKRKMRPYGSSFWLRWPEIGIGLEPLDEDPTSFKLDRWRGDRLATDWPKTIYRSKPWPFEGTW